MQADIGKEFNKILLGLGFDGLQNVLPEWSIGVFMVIRNELVKESKSVDALSRILSLAARYNKYIGKVFIPPDFYNFTFKKQKNITETSNI